MDTELDSARALDADDRINLECLADALRATGKAGGANWIEAALEDIDRLRGILAAVAELPDAWDDEHQSGHDSNTGCADQLRGLLQSSVSGTQSG